MRTPRDVAELQKLLSEAAIEAGQGDEDAGLSVGEVVSVCWCLKSMASGSVADIYEDEVDYYRHCALERTGDRPYDGTEWTPETEAVSLLSRYEGLPSEAPSGVTHQDILPICMAIVDIPMGNYAYPLVDPSWLGHVPVDRRGFDLAIPGP
jgi:hypothetical protein